MLLNSLSLYSVHSHAAEMVSKCAVDGTRVKFQCTGAKVWYVNYRHINELDNMVTITLEAAIDANNITTDDLEIDYIFCHSSHLHDDASLIVVGKWNLTLPSINFCLSC